MSRSRSRSRSSKSRRAPLRAPAQSFALAVFSFLVVIAPLAFGAVDRLTQIIIALIFAAGLFAWPPQVGRLSTAANRLVIAAVLIVVLKELAPSGLFGRAAWRTTLAESYGVSFPWTHNPEPGRALDAWLTGVLAVLWFLWVRTLAAERDDRPVLAWSLFGAAAVMAGVAFMTRDMDPKAIYGMRLTEGWTGFGPFPNRNHTACFLAMGAVLGAACIAWAGSRARLGLVAAGVPMLILVLVALLETHSRGGVVVLAVGMAIFLGVVLLKLRDRRALGAAVGAALLIVTLTVISGSETLSRFSGGSATGEISTTTRQAIWKDTVAMWREAPLFGHGAGSFGSLFPMFQKSDFEMLSVAHPESSWLLWLTEMGLVFVLLGVAGLVIVAAPHARVILVSDAAFFLRAAGLAAAAGLLVHCFFDVPAGRWGTGGFALAALALACPRRSEDAPGTPLPQCAYVPLAVASFWTLPFLIDGPAWSPLQLKRIIDREMATGQVPIEQLQRAVACFPLNPTLHHLLGLRLVAEPGQSAAWPRHFRIAARLVPTSWMLPQTQARAALAVSPHVGFHYWQLAIERGGHRVEELFGEALRETERVPNAAAVWESYVEAHPELALIYAERLPEEEGRRFFELWWRERGLSRVPLRERETRDFYRLAPHWSSPDQFAEWVRQRSELRSTDYRTWAALLHGWGQDDAAWQLLWGVVGDPKFSGTVTKTPRGDLEARYRSHPEDIVNARNFAHVLMENGERKAAEELILNVAERPDAPVWFIRKGANILVADGRLAEGVALMLREKGT